MNEGFFCNKCDERWMMNVLKTILKCDERWVVNSPCPRRVRSSASSFQSPVCSLQFVASMASFFKDLWSFWGSRALGNRPFARGSMLPWALGWHSWPPLGPPWPFWSYFSDAILPFQAMQSYFFIKNLFRTSLGTLFYKKYSKRYLQNPEKPWKTIEKPWFFKVFQGFTIFVFWPVLWRFFAPK